MKANIETMIIFQHKQNDDLQQEMQWFNIFRNTYGSLGPGRGKSWTNVTFFLKIRGCYGQRKAKIHTISSPTILS